MATNGGPDIISDGLIYGYDADSRTTRFFPGEPTTNEANTNAKRTITFHAGTGVLSDAPERGLGWKKIVINSTTANVRILKFPYITHPIGVTKTYSATFDFGNLLNEGYYVRIDGYGGSGTTVYETNGLVHNTFTASGAGGSSSIFINNNTTSRTGLNDIIYYKEYQVETKPHVTPFTDTSRSATQSLIDLKKTTSIDVSNVSFDSTAHTSFDGSDDHISTTLDLLGNGSPHSIEMIFSSNVSQGSIGSRKDPFSIGLAAVGRYSALDVNTTNMNWYFYSRDTSFTNTPTMVANQYYHMVLSYSGGSASNVNKKVWINGIGQALSAGSSDVPTMPDNPNLYIGRDGGRNTAYWPGKIPIFKVYNTALTEDDMFQNFNAYKNRFNL